MAVKEKALRRLADKLNVAGVHWAMGASWLLVCKGVADVYHDFDLVVAEEDWEKADKALSRLGMKTEDKECAYGGRHCDYHFDGADIDMRTPYVIDGKYHMCFDENAIAEDVTVQGATVHLMHLEDWLVLYALMGTKEHRVKQLLDYFAANGAAHPERFAKAVAEPLPDELNEKIQALIKE